MGGSMCRMRQATQDLEACSARPDGGLLDAENSVAERDGASSSETPWMDSLEAEWRANDAPHPAPVPSSDSAGAPLRGTMDASSSLGGTVDLDTPEGFVLDGKLDELSTPDGGQVDVGRVTMRDGSWVGENGEERSGKRFDAATMEYDSGDGWSAAGPRVQNELSVGSDGSFEAGSGAQLGEVGYEARRDDADSDRDRSGSLGLACGATTPSVYGRDTDGDGVMSYGYQVGIPTPIPCLTVEVGQSSEDPLRDFGQTSALGPLIFAADALGMDDVNLTVAARDAVAGGGGGGGSTYTPEEAGGGGGSLHKPYW